MTDIVKIDALERKLLELLTIDADQSSQKLARLLGVSSSTVRRRIHRLKRLGVLRIIGVSDPAKFGIAVNVVIGMNISLDKLSQAIEKISTLDGVVWVINTTGRYNILTFVRFRSHQDLSKFLENELVKVEGLTYSETFVCLDVTRGKGRQITI